MCNRCCGYRFLETGHKGDKRDIDFGPQILFCLNALRNDVQRWQ